LKDLIDQSKTWRFPRFGSLEKEDSQDENIFVMRKQPRLPKSRGDIVVCFLCYQNHFAIDCPLKEKLDKLEEFQVQLTIKKKLAALEVATQVKQCSKEILEDLGALTSSLGEFMATGHGCGLQVEGVDDLFCVDTTVSGMKVAMLSGMNVAALVDISATHSFVSERTSTPFHRNPNNNVVSFKVVNSTMKSTIGMVCYMPLKVGD